MSSKALSEREKEKKIQAHPVTPKALEILIEAIDKLPTKDGFLAKQILMETQKTIVDIEVPVNG